MSQELVSLVRSLGPELSPAMIQGTQRFLAVRCGGIEPRTAITRDLSYGPHERHRLDVFSTAGRSDAPVLVFVHGGGFVAGDKRSPDLPFYDNVNDFAVRSGWVGVSMTYRLAPAHPWPAGSEDVAATVSWLRGHIAEYGGDPRKIYLLGQSAGAVHVAGYVVDPRSRGLAGALLISGAYDIAQADPNLFQRAYYGEDRDKWGACSTLAGLVKSEIPLRFAVSEYDAADFQRQAALLVDAYLRAHGRFPPLHWLPGHNHLSPVLAVGSTLDTLGPYIRDFITA